MTSNWDRDSVQCDIWVSAKQTKPCVMGKLVKKEQDHVASFDIVRRAEPVSLEMKRYLLTSVVERSRFLKVYRIQSPIQVVECFEKLNAWRERVMSVT